MVSSRNKSYLRHGLERWVLPRVGSEPMAIKNLSQKAWPKVAALTAAREYGNGVEIVELEPGEEARADRILEERAAASNPVIIRGLYDSTSWTFDRVAELVGETEVNIRVGDYAEAPGDPDLVRMTVAAFVDYLQDRTAFPHPERLVNGLGPYIGNQPLPAMAGEVPKTAVATENNGVYFWIGGKGARTPLHCHQHSDPVLVQLVGQRRVAMVPPHQAPLIGCYPVNLNICTAALDPFEPDPTSFPGLDMVNVLHCDLGPGDALLIPGFWFHAIHLDGPSASGTVSSRNSMPASIDGGPRRPWRTNEFSFGW